MYPYMSVCQDHSHTSCTPVKKPFYYPAEVRSMKYCRTGSNSCLFCIEPNEYLTCGVLVVKFSFSSICKEN